jgi:hypothetical chaperone protein
MSACGLDFGTSNTTLGVWEAANGAGGPGLLALEGEHRTLPSAIFFERAGGVRIGRSAIDAYVEGVEGRLMRSLKSALGSTLLDEVTQLGRERAPFRDVLQRFLFGVKRRAEERCGHALDSVVHGRPVHFVDDDAEGDARAEAALEQIAGAVGFKHVAFQFEPIAAALDYEQQISGEELALIADIGGGTSDFSIVRLGPDRRARADRTADILANDGVRVGGTDFDRVLSLRSVMPVFGYGSPMKRRELDVPSRYFHDLASWHSINRVYEPKMLAEVREVRREAAEPQRIDRLIQVIEERRGHALAGAVEDAKIALSEQPSAAVPLGWIKQGSGVRISRDALTAGTADLADRIAARIGNCLRIAGVDAARIDALFLTGGSTRLAQVRSAITAAMPGARVIEGDTFGSVGLGLTIEAHRRFGT